MPGADAMQQQEVLVGFDGHESSRQPSGNFVAKVTQALGAKQHQQSKQAATSNQQHKQQQQQQQQEAESVVKSSSNALTVLERLQSLPWQRVDVSFQHAKMSFFAHNNIQVTRRWMNWEGAAVCEHLPKQLAIMEKDQCIQAFIAE